MEKTVSNALLQRASLATLALWFTLQTTTALSFEFDEH